MQNNNDIVTWSFLEKNNVSWSELENAEMTWQELESLSQVEFLTRIRPIK